MRIGLMRVRRERMALQKLSADPASWLPDPKDLGKLRGKGVAIVKGKVVASGTDFEAVHKRAKRQHPTETVGMFRIPRQRAMLY